MLIQRQHVWSQHQEDYVTQWLEDHHVLLYCLSAASVLTFIIGLVVVPIVLVRIPADFFQKADRSKPRALHWLIIRNTVGWIAILLGVAMLLLPGQGLLTILLGLSLVDFPGKYHLERWIISRRAILASANWLRRKFNTPPLKLSRRHSAQT